MFTLAISCLTTSNLSWFMDLSVQVPIQYWYLQHQTLLLSPVISITGCCFCFGSVSSFFLELFNHCSPVAYWAPTYLGSSSFSVLSFCLFILLMGFSWHPFNISEHLFSGYLARLFLHEFLKYSSLRKDTYSLLYRLHEPLASENFTDGPQIAVSDTEVSWAKPQNSTAT